MERYRELKLETEQLKSNLEEVRARGGELYVFADHDSGMNTSERVHVLSIERGGDHVAPIIFTPRLCAE